MGISTFTFFRRLRIEDWHNVGDDDEPDFENDWASKGTPWSPVGFRLDALGNILLRGALDAAGQSGDGVFTLPEDFRPDFKVGFPVVLADQTVELLTVTADGAVECTADSGTVILDSVVIDPHSRG